MSNQSLQAFFIHKIIEINKTGRHDKKQDDSCSDDKELDPFLSCNQCDGQQKNVTCESDEDNNKKCIFSKEWIGGNVIPNRQKYNEQYNDGEEPPDQFNLQFLVS